MIKNASASGKRPRPKKRVQTLLGALCVACTPLAVSSGCNRGDGIERVPLAGVVTYQGSVIEDGQIRFLPALETTGPLTIASIKKGKYDTTHTAGVPVGEHRVEIRSYDPQTPPPSGPGAPPRRQLLPDEFNTKSKLRITLSAGQDPSHNFELPE